MTADHQSDPNYQPTNRGTVEPGRIKVPSLKPSTTTDAATPETEQGELGATSLSEAPPAPVRSLDRFSMLDRTDELEANAIISQPLLGEGIRSGQLTIIYAEPNTGKTLITTALGRTAILAGLIAPTDFYYINADDSSEGVLVKGRLWQELGAHMLVPGLGGFETHHLMELMRQDILNDRARGTCVVIDTAKKFADLMSKKEASQFGKRCREYTLAGGTVILIAHTAKNRNADGSLRYQGVTDFKEDCDAMYTAELLVAKSDGVENVVKLTREKSRGPNPKTIAYAYASDPELGYEARVASVHEIDPKDLDNYVSAKEPNATVHVRRNVGPENSRGRDA
jgi:archaellum biogenesis ATPase FlaH